MPRTRQFVNAYDIIQEWCRTVAPDNAFSGKTPADVAEWQRRFRRQYRRMLGPWPKPCPRRVKTVEVVQRDGYRREKIDYDSSVGVTVPAYVLVPDGVDARNRRPGILAAHGHGRGKDDICGITRERANPDETASVDALNYEYAVQAARHGYVVIAPDWLPFGERRPDAEWSRAGRDPCNVVDMAWQYFGYTVLGQNVWDGMRAVDVLSARPEVDGRRMGVLGLSYGGTMTSHLIVNDRRLNAAVISGYLSTVRGDALNMRGKGNTCGSQHVPQLLVHGDIPDVVGLAAPKPILAEMGQQENCFHFPDMQKAYRHLQTIYRAAGAADRLAADRHPHAHRWSGAKAWKWLAKWLG